MPLGDRTNERNLRSSHDAPKKVDRRHSLGSELSERACLSPRDSEADQANTFPGHPSYQPMEVTIKNTFINLPDPFTPEKSGTKQSRCGVTCPAKYAATEHLRLSWVEEREQALEAVSSYEGRCEEAKATVTPTDPSLSVGALLHRAGLCKPCAWFHHPKGCQRGVRCEFCHACAAGEIKRRKKEKTMQIRRRRTKEEERKHPIDRHSRVNQFSKAQFPPSMRNEYSFTLPAQCTQMYSQQCMPVHNVQCDVGYMAGMGGGCQSYEQQQQQFWG